jgi:hypothetical protein
MFIILSIKKNQNKSDFDITNLIFSFLEFSKKAQVVVKKA